LATVELRDAVPRFWALRAFTRFGNAIAALGAVLPLAASVTCMTPGPWNWPLLAAAVVAGLAAGFFIKVFSDLAQVIVDMLLPVQN
jgi:hypothetical protein